MGAHLEFLGRSPEPARAGTPGGENKERIVAAAEFHASLMSDAPAAVFQPAPSWLTCTGPPRPALP